MPSAHSPKTGILLLNMGGPDKLENVKPFLLNLFSDPDIIRLPFSAVLQKPLAWQIVTSREEEAKKNYRAMGGSSPILQFTQDQGKALLADLAARGHDNLHLYIAMRYWHPYTTDTIEQIARDGIERLVVLPMYPHFSYTTTGSSLNELRRVLQERIPQLKLELSIIPSYFDHPIYQKAVAEHIQQAMDQNPWSCEPEKIHLLFTAHSLPQKHVKRTKDPYPEQIEATAQQITKTFFPNNTWDLSYQSQVGKMVWLGPSTDGVLHYYAGKNMDNILMIPISFVSDHIETLVEVDQLYIPLAHELGIPHCHRTPALNTSPTFIQTLSALVIAELETPEANVPQVPTFPELLKSQAAK